MQLPPLLLLPLVYYYCHSFCTTAAARYSHQTKVNGTIPVRNADGRKGDDDGAGGSGQANKLSLLRPEQLVLLAPVSIAYHAA